MDFSVKVEGLDKIQNATLAVQKAVEAELKKGLYASAKKVEGEAKRSITAGGKTGRIYKRRSVTHQASAPGEAPASDTGALVNRGFRVEPEDTSLSVAVIVGTEYAKALEFGTTKMAARPFMFPALEKSKAWIAERLAQAVRTAAAKSVK